MAQLPENPTVEQIETIHRVMKLHDLDEGEKMQEKYKTFCTSFGLKAAAYHRLLDYLNSGA
jgi:hypothetical protein